MVSFINGWSQVSSSTLQSIPQTKNSSIGERIIASARSAIAMVAGNGAEQTKAALALLMLCTVGGVGFIWLFKKCCGCGSNHVTSHPVPVPVPQPGYNQQKHWGWVPNFSSFPKFFIPAKQHGNSHFVPAGQSHPTVFVPANQHPVNPHTGTFNPANLPPAIPYSGTFIPASQQGVGNPQSGFIPASQNGAGAPQSGFIPASSATSAPKHFVPAVKPGFIPTNH